MSDKERTIIYLDRENRFSEFRIPPEIFAIEKEERDEDNRRMSVFGWAILIMFVTTLASIAIFESCGPWW